MNSLMEQHNGIPLSPFVANLYMVHLEENAMQTALNQMYR